VIDVVLRAARLAHDLPPVAELELNPVIMGPDGCCIVGARVRVSAAAHAARTKTW
jgi:hypothetical protein